MAKTSGVDIDAIISANQRGPAGPKCRICVALDLMSDDVRAKVQAAMDDRERFGNRNIGDIINAIGVRSSTGMPIEVGINGVDRHRRGGCSTHKRSSRG
jgi:hypothetical protein